MASRLDGLIQKARDCATRGTIDLLAAEARRLHAALYAEVRTRHLRQAISLLRGCERHDQDPLCATCHRTGDRAESWDGERILDSADLYLVSQLPQLCSEEILADAPAAPLAPGDWVTSESWHGHVTRIDRIEGDTAHLTSGGYWLVPELRRAEGSL